MDTDLGSKGCKDSKSAIYHERVTRQERSESPDDISRPYIELHSASSSVHVYHIERQMKYQEQVLNELEPMEYKRRRNGEHGALTKRYQKLTILKTEKCLETISSGMKSLVRVDQWSKLPSCSIDAFFDPDDVGCTPRTVVLLGATGVGKTMTARKILLEWALGKLFQDRFEYVFYIPCSDHNRWRAEQTIETLVEHNGPEYGFKSKNRPLVSRREIEAEPRKVLFIIDGFDQLRIGKDQLLADPDKTSLKDSTLIRLIRKEYLPESYIIITTRPEASETLTQRLTQCDEDMRFVEILGFSEDDRKEYFNHFFENATHGELVFNIVRENDLLFTLCFAPVVCWIVCQAFEQQMEKKVDSVPDLRTITSVYLLFLSSLLTPQSSDAAQSIFNKNLKSLCALAKEGIYEGKTQFKDSDIARHGLDIPSIQSLFLTDDMFHKVDRTDNLYGFLHLSFQEFFAALFYILKDNETTEQTVSPEPDVIQLLKDYRTHDHRLMLTVRFLFGLLSEERLDQMEKGLYWSVSSDIKPAVEKWIKKVIPGEYVWNHKYYQLDQLEWFHCLYEIQDEEFVKSATEHLKEFTLHEPYPGTQWNDTQRKDTQRDVTRWNVTDFKALVFCLQNSLGVRVINLSAKIEPEGLRVLMPGLMNCRTLRMWSCFLNGSYCADLASVLRTNTSLTDLELNHNNLGDSGVRELCEGLKHPLCTLKTLSLERTGLTDDVTRSLCLALRRNKSLLELNLWGNRFTRRSVASFHTLKESVPEIRTQFRCSYESLITETYSEAENKHWYRIVFTGRGAFPCDYTGLCFEVDTPGRVTYQLRAWDDHLTEPGMQDLVIAGPLFDITVDPGLVKAVYLPHFVCLEDGDVDTSLLQIAHFGADGGITLENPSEVQAFHVVLKNPTFSPIGVVMRFAYPLRKRFPVRACVLLYQALSAAEITLHLYVIPNWRFIKQEIDRLTKCRLKIEKPSQTRALQFGSWYGVNSEPDTTINPEELEFDYLSPCLELPYAEIYLDDFHAKGVDICLQEKEGSSALWKATVRPGDVDRGIKASLAAPESFIQRHRLNLIERMGNIKSIMEILRYKHILQNEEIEDVLAEKISSSKNSKLIQMVVKKGTESMQEFLLALRKKDPLLYTHLEQSN